MVRNQKDCYSSMTVSLSMTPRMQTLVRTSRTHFGEAFPDAQDDLLLTYFVVNKSTDIKYDQPKVIDAAKIDPILDDKAESDGLSKYRCYVVRTDNDWDESELIKLASTSFGHGPDATQIDIEKQTRSINKSSQLCSHTQLIASSLPTMLAGKLCKRISDYFRFDRELWKDLPEILREPREINEHDTNQQCLMIMNAVFKVKEFLNTIGPDSDNPPSEGVGETGPDEEVL
jgi:hypothetical protein